MMSDFVKGFLYIKVN
jgi:hypothetical protein